MGGGGGQSSNVILAEFLNKYGIPATKETNLLLDRLQHVHDSATNGNFSNHLKYVMEETFK